MATDTPTTATATRAGHDLDAVDKNVRISAALTIGEQRDAEALDALIAALRDDPDFFVRETVTWALLRLGERSLDPLLQLAEHDSARVRHDAVHALSKLQYDRAALVLWERLFDSDDRVVARAAFALGLLRERGAVPELVSLLGHDTPEVRTAAVEALERLGSLALADLAEALVEGEQDVRPLAASILGTVGGAVSAKALREGLDDGDWQVRVAVLMALSRVAGDAARRAVSSAADDPDRRVRAVASRLSSSRTG